MRCADTTRRRSQGVPAKKDEQKNDNLCGERPASQRRNHHRTQASTLDNPPNSPPPPKSTGVRRGADGAAPSTSSLLFGGTGWSDLPL